MAKRIAPKSTSKTSKSKSSSKFGKSVKGFWSKLVRFIFIATIVFFVLSIGSVFFYKWVDPPFTYLMAKRKLTALIHGKSSKINYEFVSERQMSDYIRLAVVSSEDQKFPTHNGFDLVSIAKAMEKNRFSKKVKGASTISQQVAKNVFLWDGRNFVRKGLDAYFTFLIEIIWGKRRILEVYVNVAEMGPMTFGVEAASRKYFDKSAKKLSPVQAASIAAVLPNPILFSVKKPSRFILGRTDWILSQMNNLGGVSYIKEMK